ncbi:tandem-95 repeat protein, partial [Pseudahrensia aquimaris]
LSDLGSNGTVTILMVAVNDAPVANDDAVTTPEEVAVALNPTLPGDVDDLTTVLTVTVDQLPNATTEGTISYTPDGGGAAVTLALGDTISVAELATTLFTPATDFNGTATSFAYTVSDDGGASDTGSVAITVTPINDAPDAASDAVTANEDVPTLLTVTPPVDVDDVAAALTATINQVPLPGEGTIIYTPDGGGSATLAAGDTLSMSELATLSFTSAPDYTGPVTPLSYTVTDDDGLSDAGSNGTVNIAIVPVNDAPVGNTDAVSVTEDTPTPLNPTAPTDIDDAPADLTVTITAIPNPTSQGVVSYTPDGGGTATLLAGDALSLTEFATLSFAPVADYDGLVDAITYTVADDDGLTDTGSIAITLVAVNDAPDAVVDTVDVTEDTATPLAITLPSDVDDVPADLSVIITQTPLAGEGTITYTPDGGGADLTLAAGDTLTLSELATATFTPVPDYTGPVTSLTYTAQDDEFAADAGSFGTVDITIVPVNDAPVGNTDAVSVTEDTPTPLNPTAPTDIDDAPADLTVTITAIPNPTSQGVVSYTPDGGGTATLLAGDALSLTEFATLSFAPVADYDGLVDAITYTVADDDGLTDTGSIAITLVAVNDAPDAFDNTVSANEDVATALNITLPSDVDDVPADLSVTITQVPTAGQGTIRYTPDGGGTALVLAAGDALTLSELATATFRGAADYTGPVTPLTYAVADDAGASDAGSVGTVDITIVPVNDAPVANTDFVSVIEDTPTALNPTAPTDVDDVDASLVITVTQIPNPTSQGVVSYTDGGGATQTLTAGTVLTPAEFDTLSFTPATDYAGSVDLLRYSVADDDGATTTAGTIAIVLTPINDAPEAFADVVGVAEEGTVALNVTAPVDVDDVAANLTARIDQVPGASQGVLSYTPDGGGAAQVVAVGDDLSMSELASVTFTGASDFNGPVTQVIYTVRDDAGASDAGSVGTVDITVTPVNDAPEGNVDAVSVTEDTVTPLTPTLPSDVDDVAADLTVTINTVPNAATQGTVRYTDAGGATQTLSAGDALTVTEFATLSFAPVADYDGAVDAV